MIRPSAAERGFVLALIASAAVHAALLPLFLSFASGASMHAQLIEGSLITAFLVPGEPAAAGKASVLPAVKQRDAVGTETEPAVPTGEAPVKALRPEQEGGRPHADIRPASERSGTQHDAAASLEKGSQTALALVVPEAGGSSGGGGGGIPEARQASGASSRGNDPAGGLSRREETGGRRHGEGAPSPKDADAVPRYGDNALPAYPPLARLRGYQGMAVLSVEVLADGCVGQVGLSRSTGHEILDRTALETVRSWKFEPGRRAGRPVAMSVAVPVRFVLRGDSILVKTDDRR